MKSDGKSNVNSAKIFSKLYVPSETTR